MKTKTFKKTLEEISNTLSMYYEYLNLFNKKENEYLREIDVPNFNWNVENAEELYDRMWDEEKERREEYFYSRYWICSDGSDLELVFSNISQNIKTILKEVKIEKTEKFKKTFLETIYGPYEYRMLDDFNWNGLEFKVYMRYQRELKRLLKRYMEE